MIKEIKAKKIIYLHQYFNTPDMSGGTRSYEFAKRLVHEGNQVIMVTSFRDKNTFNYKPQQNIEGIDVRWLKCYYNNNLNFLKRIISFLLFSIKSFFLIIRIKNVNLIFATSTPLTIAIPAIIFSKIRGIPMIFEVRDLWPEMPIAMKKINNKILIKFLFLFEKYIYNYAKKIIVLSPGMYKSVLKVTNNKNKIVIVPNSCDIKIFLLGKLKYKFKNYDFDLANKFSILYAGSIGEVNGLAYLVDLCKNLKKINSKIQFIIVGDGKEFNKIDNYANKLGVHKTNFFIYKYIPKNQIIDLFASVDMVASIFTDIPEMQSNSANKFFDGLAAGKPIFINYGGWHKNILESYNAGISSYNLSLEHTAKKLDNFSKNIKKQKTFSMNSKKLAKNYFSRDALYKIFSENLNSDNSISPSTKKHNSSLIYNV